MSPADCPGCWERSSSHLGSLAARYRSCRSNPNSTCMDTYTSYPAEEASMAERRREESSIGH
eukprot:581015-Hanusia_phi.AAC.1